MRRAMTLAALTLTGCGSFFQHMTGSGTRLNPSDTWPHEVEYELLAPATGKACAALDALSVRKGASTDPALNGPPALYEQAKFIAIGSVSGADGLAAIRTQAEHNEQNGFVCVTVIGRAYRLTKLRAGASPATTQAASAQAAQTAKPIPPGIMPLGN